MADLFSEMIYYHIMCRVGD